MLPLFLPLSFQAPIDRLDALAQSRNVSGLNAFLADSVSRSPFGILRTGGGYAAGSLGWHAKALEPPDGSARYIVFTTPILAEDMGELLFQVTPAGKLKYIPERDNFGVRLDSHTFDVSFDLPAHRVSVVDTIRTARVSAGYPHFFFRLSPTFTVSSISDPSNRPLRFVQSGGIVAVSAGGGDQVLTIRYAGTVDKPGFRNVIGPTEATLSGTVWYPMIARHPAAYDITMHAPKSWLSLAQGDEVSSKVVGDESVTKYHMSLPVVWISATTGPYKRAVDTIGGRQYATISATATEEAMHAQNADNAEVVDFYSKTFSPYPFKCWTTIDSRQFRQGVGALEGYSFATYPAGRLPFQDSHEPAHTWWGGIINNDYLASIWNESFADYSQVVFRRDYPIGNREERKRAYAASSFYNPIFDTAPLARSGQDIGPAATALGYQMGAYVLQVLEDELGTDIFLKTLREWIRSNPRGHIGSWEDYEAVVDRVAGRKLTWFFDEWVRRPGLPNLALSSGNWENGVFTGQVTFKGESYRIDTDAVAEFADGSKRLFRVAIDPQQNGRFTMPCPTRPTVVAIDPWQIIPRHGNIGQPAITLRSFERDRVYLGRLTPDAMKGLRGSDVMDSMPQDLDGMFVVGSPESLPALAPLCKQAGFEVSGRRLTYKGTTIDLATGGAIAVVDLPGGKHCMIGLGKCDVRPDFGRARLAVLDEKGRILRAETDPVDYGPLAIRL